MEQYEFNNLYTAVNHCTPEWIFFLIVWKRNDPVNSSHQHETCELFGFHHLKTGYQFSSPFGFHHSETFIIGHDQLTLIQSYRGEGHSSLTWTAILTCREECLCISWTGPWWQLQKTRPLLFPGPTCRRCTWRTVNNLQSTKWAIENSRVLII
jgi:hypothetical protein